MHEKQGENKSAIHINEAPVGVLGGGAQQARVQRFTILISFFQQSCCQYSNTAADIFRYVHLRAPGTLRSTRATTVDKNNSLTTLNQRKPAGRLNTIPEPSGWLLLRVFEINNRLQAGFGGKMSVRNGL